MALQLVYETHSISVDNERGIATGFHSRPVGVISTLDVAAALAEVTRRPPPTASADR